MTGRVEHVHIAPEASAPVERRESVQAVADAGLEGDRYYDEAGTFSDSDRDVSRDVTFIEAESIEAVERDYDVEIDPGEHRRNVTLRDVPVNHLVDRRFRVGDVVCEGTELCEPCSYLENLLEKRGVEEAFVHRGGIRARIVDGGELGVGDSVELL